MWPLLRAVIQFAPFPELHFGFGFLRLAGTSASELLQLTLRAGCDPHRYPMPGGFPENLWQIIPRQLEAMAGFSWAPEGQFEFEVLKCATKSSM